MKRKVGERAISYLDSIDLSIIEILNHSQGGVSVLNLAERLQLKHKNLKPHIDKLMFLNIIFAFKDNEGKTKIYTTMKNMDELSIIEFDDDEKEYSKALKQQEHDKALVNFLEKIRDYYYDIEMKKHIDIDLRRKKDLPKQINYKKERAKMIRNEKIANEIIEERKSINKQNKSKNSFKVTKTTENKHKKSRNTN